MCKCHFNSTTSGHKSCIDHYVSGHIHSILQITFNLIENIFAGAAKQNRACFRILALNEECEVPEIFFKELVTTVRWLIQLERRGRSLITFDQHRLNSHLTNASQLSLISLQGPLDK